MRGSIGSKFLGSFITAIIVIGVVIGVMCIICGIDTRKGHELGIRETISGVDQTGGPEGDGIYTPGKKLYIRALTDYIHYDMRKHHYKLTDETDSQGDDPSDGPAYMFQVDGGQEVKVGWDIVWRYNRDKLQVVHAQVRDDIAEAERKLLANPVKLIMQNLVTTEDALSIYYGEGLVSLQSNAFHRISTYPAIADAGIIIDSVVVLTELHPDYKQQIHDKVVAEQKEIAQGQIAKANIAEALAAKEEAEIARQKVVIEAEAQKDKQVLAAEADNLEEILKAEAEAKKLALQGQGERDKQVAEAEGLLAMKLAEAEGEEKLKMAKFDGPSGALNAQVLTAELTAARLAGMLTDLKVVPESTFLSLMDSASYIGMSRGVQPIVDVRAVAEK